MGLYHPIERPTLCEVAARNPRFLQAVSGEGWLGGTARNLTSAISHGKIKRSKKAGPEGPVVIDF